MSQFNPSFAESFRTVIKNRWACWKYPYPHVTSESNKLRQKIYVHSADQFYFGPFGVHSLLPLCSKSKNQFRENMV